MTKKKKSLTTDDIESATIYLNSKDGRVCVANVTDKLLIYTIAATQKFVEVDANKVVRTTIGDIK